jgi:hypothetical protein
MSASKLWKLTSIDAVLKYGTSLLYVQDIKSHQQLSDCYKIPIIHHKKTLFGIFATVPIVY